MPYPARRARSTPRTKTGLLRIALVSGLVLSAVAGAAGTAVAAGSDGPRPVPGPPAGQVTDPAGWASGIALRLRLNDRYTNGTYYIWKLRPGGRADGVGHTYLNEMSLRGGNLLEENDVGRWRAADGLLCIAWPRFFLGREHCYRVTPFGPGKVRFTSVGGGPSFDADWSRTERRY